MMSIRLNEPCSQKNWIETTETVQGHFDRSNFAVEIHQAFLDLTTIGSATLLFEEAPLGGLSAFRLSAVPMSEMYFEAGPDGQILGHFRCRSLPARTLKSLFPHAALPEEKSAYSGDDDPSLPILEAVLPEDKGFAYFALLMDKPNRPTCLARGLLPTSPFISFRWLKGAAEVYGRSPVMTALPDIKTVNKVVELVLEERLDRRHRHLASRDDGVLNPANIRLVPGTIIPKAVGSSGLTPLQAPGRFDVSNLMLDDLRGRIRHALLVDRLGPVGGRRMTATEILERSNEMSRLLGATYGRLQTELLTPLISQGMRILGRRGEIPDITLDGRTVTLQYRSPLARSQARDDVQNTLMWLETSAQLGPEAMQAVNVPATTRWLGERLGVPGQLVRDLSPITNLISELLPADIEEKKE